MQIKLSINWIWLLVSLCGVPYAAEAQFRALLIGINYVGADRLIPPLGGAVQDVEVMHVLMTEQLGIPSSAIRVLKEAQASRSAILNHIEQWLIAGTKAGDDVFLMFAGHGLQVPNPVEDQTTDPDKREETAAGLKLAEALAPYDTVINPATYEISGLILDNEIHQRLLQLNGRRVTLWLDNCHSGGATRDFGEVTRFRVRQLVLPWKPEDTHVAGVNLARTRGIRSFNRAEKLPYRYFAAARYYQKALEERGRGVFTLALTELLAANPNARYTNHQILKAVRDFIHHHQQIPPDSQEPVFYGSNAEDEIFPLLNQASAPLAFAPQHPATPIMTDANPTRISIPQSTAHVLEQLRTAISKYPDELRIDENNPDLILKINHNEVLIYHPAGALLNRLSSGGAESILNALFSYHIEQQLGKLHNLANPFQVELWLNQADKTQFRRNERVILNYRVKRLPYSQAYLTLLNLAPDGTLTLLYPQPQRGSSYPHNPRRIHLNAPVEPGRIHTIPQGQTALRRGENIAIDLQMRLAQVGTEHFKALVTPQPIQLEQLDERLLSTGLQAAAASAFIARLQHEIIDAKLSPTNWGAGDLSIIVTAE